MALSLSKALVGLLSCLLVSGTLLVTVAEAKGPLVGSRPPVIRPVGGPTCHVPGSGHAPAPPLVRKPEPAPPNVAKPPKNSHPVFHEPDFAFVKDKYWTDSNGVSHHDRIWRDKHGALHVEHVY